jgi:2-C-methyl-D-erythritol 4-phosphate cytidylyltransferase
MKPNSAPTRFFALIPCAGNGSRAGTQQPKQYQPIAGKPMVMHTLEAFAGVVRIERTLLVLGAGDGFSQLPNDRFFIAPCGGSTRSGSVLNGLNALLDASALPQDWVLVHDAARCLVTPAQINALIDACQHDAVGGLLAHRLADTLKAEAGLRVQATIDRASKWLAQTPQMFRIGQLREALMAAGDAVTDESSAMELAGRKPLLVPGSALNFKVTYPEDFALAEAVLVARLGLNADTGSDAGSGSGTI